MSLRAGGASTLRWLWACSGHSRYDWLGNTSVTDDDLHAFYDRSLGAVSNNGYQLSGASQPSGSLTTAYDAAGNLISMDVARSGPCTVTDGCALQHYTYEWDEVGRLVRASRDGQSLEYTYDASDQRVRKSFGGSHTLYVFGSYELRGASHDGLDYTLEEVPYLFANGVRLARVVSQAGTTRVFLELGDHLGSTSVVLDRATGKLVQRSTAYAYGEVESSLRAEEFEEFREDYRFTGKEDDVEVGLIYFGKRYYAPLLGRWISADPLAVHAPGSADLNHYAYVQGKVLIAVDPVGLWPDLAAAWDSATSAAQGLANDAKSVAAQGKLAALAAAEAVVNEPLAAGAADAIEQMVDAVGDNANRFAANYQAIPDVVDPKVRIYAAAAMTGGQNAGSVAEEIRKDPVGGSLSVVASNPVSQASAAVTSAVQGDGHAVGQHATNAMVGVVALGMGRLLKTGCFVAGTLVWTSDGPVPIEAVEPGQLVLAMSEDGPGELRWARVVEAYVRQPSRILDLAFSDGLGIEQLGVTPEHPVWRDGDGWVEAGDLRVADKVWSATRGWLVVKDVHERSREPVFNLNVDGDHTYFVGWLGAWVHNAGKCGGNAKNAKGPARTEPELPPTEIAKQGELEVKHYYTGNDHGPAHAHVYGNGPNTKIGPKGKPLRGSPELSPQQAAFVNENLTTIRRAINKLGRWLDHKKWEAEQEKLRAEQAANGE